MSGEGARSQGVGRPASPVTEGQGVVEALQDSLARATTQLRELGMCLTAADAAEQEGMRQREAMSQELALAKEENGELITRLVEAEQVADRAMKLYVATYQLHSTLDPEEVRATIAEIAIDLLGVERLALVLRTDDDHYEVSLLDETERAPGLYSKGRYVGGDPMVDATLADGELRLGSDESSPLAVVPLRVHGETVGALVLFELLEHKPALRVEDREILDLLAAHAASALVAARAYATADRKLRSLESLVKLVRQT